MASTIGGAALGWKVVLQHLHHVLTLLGRLLHEQLVDFQVDRGLKAVKIGQNNNPNHSKGRLYTISFKPDDKTIPRGIGAHSKTLLLLPGSNGSEPLAFIGEVIKKIKTNKQTNYTGIFLCPTLSTTITSYKKYQNRSNFVSLSFGAADYEHSGERSGQRTRWATCLLGKACNVVQIPTRCRLVLLMFLLVLMC